MESGEPEEKILRVIRLAKRGCYAERMIRTAVPIESALELNGKSVELREIADEG